MRTMVRLVVAGLLAGSATMAIAQAPIVLPGAPGQPSRALSAEELGRLAELRQAPPFATSLSVP